MASKEQTRDFFDYMAAVWDSHAHHDPAKLELIRRLCFVKPGARILDVGCGTGALFGELLQLEPKQLVGLDLSPRMLEIAASKYEDARIQLVESDLFDYFEQGFDLALLYSVYPHFEDKAALVAHLAARLRPGGRFLLAHSESRAKINNRHSGPGVKEVASLLMPAEEEARRWRSRFTVDMLIEREELYLISGSRN